MTDLSEIDGILQVPFSLEAERAVIGAVLMDPAAHERVADLLKTDDFFTSKHRLAWGAIETAVAAGRVPDPVTVAEAVQPAWREDCPFEFLQGLAFECGSSFSIRTYAEIVRDRRVRRDVMGAAEKLRELALLDQQRPATEILDDAQSLLLGLGQSNASAADDGVSLGDALDGVIRATEMRELTPDSLGGASTGLEKLDDMTDGLQAGDLIVIAGRPSMGKTALAMNIGQVVGRGGKTVQVFSLEMPTSQIAQRMLASDAGISLQDLRRAKLDRHDWAALNEALGRLKRAPIIIDDAVPLTVARLRAKAKRLSRKAAAAGAPLGLIIVDYLQLMSGAGDKRNEIISEISRGLKLLAKELQVPVIALSQLNRKVEERPNKRPTMSDIRDSGAVEQDADVIIFIYRDQVYHENSPDVGTAELIIGKQRNGPPGTVRVAFIEQEATFKDLSPDWHREASSMGPTKRTRGVA